MNELKNTKLNKEQENESFIKKHWWKGVLALLLAAGGTGLYLGKKKGLFGKKNHGTIIMNEFPAGNKIVNLTIPEGFESAVISDLWTETDKDGNTSVLCIAEDIPIKHLGKFGEELVKRVPEMANMDSACIAPMGFYRFNWDLAGEGARDVYEEVHVVVEDSLEKTLETIAKMEKERKKNK